MTRTALVEARLKKLWSQEEAAEAIGIDHNTLYRWEAGKATPRGYNLRQLCEVYGMSAEELGFEQKRQADSEGEEVAQPTPVEEASGTLPASSGARNIEPALSVHLPPSQSLANVIDLLLESSDLPLEQQVGTWLALGANSLGALFEEGWSVQDVLYTLGILLQGVQAMPAISRRRLIQLGVTAVVSNISIPSGKNVSQEQRMQLSRAFTESIDAGWKLFTLARNSQVLAVSQAQLILLQQAHTVLPARERSILYSSIYNHMGLALYLQEQHHQALGAYTNAYIASLGAGDIVGVTYSLLCQAMAHRDFGEYSKAIETLEQATRTFDVLDQQWLTKAHLLGVWADCAMVAGDYDIARQKLDAVAELLDHISPNEEFDQSSWCELTAKYAYLNGDYPTAAQWYEQALRTLPTEWVLRRILILSSLISTYTITQDRDASLATVEKVALAGYVSNIPPLRGKSLTQALEGLLIVFPHEARVKTIVSDLLQQIQRSTIENTLNT